MYDRIQRAASTGGRRDRSLLPHIVGVIVLSAILVVPLFNMARTMHRYQAFKQDLAESMSFAEHQGIFSRSAADRFFSLIVDAGMGKPRSTVPEAGGARCEFGDGSTLELEPEAVRENGDIVPYVRTVDKTVQVTGKLLSKKKVPLKVSTTGEKESNVKEFTIDDENIKILGEKKTLASIGSVTGTVDVTGLTQSKYRKVTFTDLPEGVEPAKKYKNIYVYVKVTKKDE